MIIKGWLKRILSILLASWLLVACSTTQEVSDDLGNTENTLSGTIVFWQSFPERYLTESLIFQYREVFAKYIEKFTKLYPQVKIIMEFKQDEELVEELKREVEKGLGPDLIFTESIYILPLIKANTLRTLDETSINLLQFRPEAIIQMLSQSKLYGVPFNLQTQVLCYNNKKVKEVPKTISELIIQARRGYSVGILSSFKDAFWGTGIFGGELLDAQGRIALDRNMGWVKWMKWLKNARNEPNFIFSEDSFLLQDAFIEEKLAYNVCWSSQIPFLRESLGSDKFGVALLPGGENEQATPPLVAYSLLFSSSSSPKQKEIALGFAQFLANKQQQQELAIQLRSFIPANKEAMIDSRLFPIQGILQKQTQKVTAFSLDQTEKINAISEYGNDFYTRVMAGEISPEQAVSQLTQTINSQFRVR